jgi:ABC-type glycerol-3-phosphate transport system permease component
MSINLHRETTIRRIYSVFYVILLCAVSLVFLYPLLWLADATFRPQIEIFQVPPMIVQKGFQSFGSYSFASVVKAVVNWNVLLAFLNSVLVTAGGIVLTLLVCSACAYAFAYLRFPLKKALFVAALATMMLPMTTMLVPFYRVLAGLGLVDNPLGLIIPYAASAFGLFLLRQYFIKIPFSFIESAKIDGAHDVRILFRIIMPLAKPALAALAITQFRQIWNDFLYPMLILRSDALFTLPIKIQVMDSQHFNKPYDAIIATGAIAALVPVCFFIVFQRQFIEGLTGGLTK